MHVMGHVPYVGCATCSRVTVKIRLYFFFFLKKKKKKNGSSHYSISSYDSALFIRRIDRGFILLLLYVDDMLITSDDSIGILELKQFLRQHFEMKDLGNLSYFLSLEISSSSDGFYLTQVKYISDLLSQANLTDCKIVDTPTKLNARLNLHDGEPLRDPTLYRHLVGSLVYLTVTRPDISYVVHQMSQFVTTRFFFCTKHL
jgi:hypothetical protein